MTDTPGLGDFVIVLLAGTLVSLRDRLHEDGYREAAEHVADLVDLTDLYIRTRPDGIAEWADPR